MNNAAIPQEKKGKGKRVDKTERRGIKKRNWGENFEKTKQLPLAWPPADTIQKEKKRNVQKPSGRRGSH